MDKGERDIIDAWVAERHSTSWWAHEQAIKHEMEKRVRYRRHPKVMALARRRTRPEAQRISRPYHETIAYADHMKRHATRGA